MIDIYSIFNSTIQGVSQKIVDKSSTKIYQAIQKYSNYTDEELKYKLNKFVTGEYDALKFTSQDFITYIYNLIGKSFLKKSANLLDIELIAIAAEAFKREPADLREASEEDEYSLYRHQLAAAIALSQKTIIQMETGEGKTYAILPTAFALACKHNQVYVICANEYLAQRDALRTSNYYNYVGLNVGLGLRGQTSIENWGARVIYTTLQSMIFKYMEDQLSIKKPLHPISFNATIIDEADSVLLDQANQEFNLIQYIEGELFDWNLAIEIAETLEPEKHITIDNYRLTCSLTIDGEYILKQRLKFEDKKFTEYLLIRKSVEIACIALKVVIEGKDYIIQNKQIFPFNKTSGKVDYNVISDWIAPLNFIKNCLKKPDSITLNSIDSNIFIKKFEHICGLSGTIKHDALEYIFSYSLPTVTIPPRNPKHKNGLRDDIVYKTKRELFKYLPQHIVEYAVDNKQPVLIGVRFIDENIENLYQALLNEPKLVNFRISIIRGRDDENIANIFESAGEINSIVITTQIGGRGVDIRLSEEARRNGGLVLFSIEHSYEIRHDKQFLGRAGRQGDPYTAFFYVSLEDSLMTMLGSQNISNLMSKLGMVEGEIIQHSMITKSILRAQNKVRQMEFFKRRSSDSLNYTFKEIYNSIDKWFTLIKTNLPTITSKLESESLVNNIIKNYYQINIRPILSKKIDYSVAKNVRNRLIETLNHNFKSSIEDKIIDQSFEMVEQEICSLILKELNKILEKNKIEIKEYKNYDEKYSNIDFEFRQIINSFNIEVARNPEDTNGKKYEGFTDKFDEKGLIFISHYKDIFNIEIDKIEDLRLLKEKIILLNKEIESNGLKWNNEIEYFRNKILKFIYKLQDDFYTTKIYELKENNYDKTFKKERRSFLDIIHWTIKRSWVDFLIEKERALHMASKEAESSLVFNRLSNEYIDVKWSKTENELPAFILNNLFQSSDIDKLDSLFVLDESKVDIDNKKSTEKLRWDSEQLFKIKFDESHEKKDTYLINEFMNSNSDLLDEISAKKLRFTLEEFLSKFPVSVLQTSQNIQNAIDNFRRQEIKQGINEERRNFNYKWIKIFFKFLYKHKYVSSLPTFSIKIEKSLISFYKNIIDLRVIFPIFQSLLGIVVIAIFSKWGTLGNKIDLEGLSYYLDLFLSFGLFSAGVITAPIFLTTIFISISEKSKLINLMAFPISILLCIPLMWNGDSISSIIRSVLLIVLILGLTLYAKNAIHQVKQTLGISLTMFVLLFSLSYGSFKMFSGLSIAELSSFIFIIFGFILWHNFFNSKELIFLSSRLLSSTSAMKEELIKTGIKIQGCTGYVPFLYALFFSIAVNALLITLKNQFDIHISEIIVFYVAIISYITILFLLTWNIISLRLSAKLWESKMNKDRTILIDSNDIEHSNILDISKVLKKDRKQFLIKEYMFHSVLIITMLILFQEQLLPYTNIPFSLVVITLAVLIGELLNRCFYELRNSLFSRMPFDFESVDLSENVLKTEEVEFKSFKEKVKFFFEPNNSFMKILKWFIGTSLLLVEIIEFFKWLF